VYKRQRLNRELKAIRNCNQALLRADNEQAILNEICRITCDEAGYRMAWVGFVENDLEKTIRIVAFAGVEDGYLDQAKLTWSDTERGRGPSGVAIRTGKSAFIQDFAVDPQAVPWRDAALKRGYHSSIALPLKDEAGYTFGLLCIYSAKTNTFTRDEVRLLEELAGDLAFGISTLRTRIERKRAEASLKKSEEEYRRIVNTASEGIWVLGPDTLTTFVNPSMADMLGYNAADMIGRSMAEFMFEEDVPDFLQKMENRHKGISENYERRFRRKDGRVVFALASTAPIFDDQHNFKGSLAMFTNITDRKQAEEREKDFYRLTILAATEGKLNLTERDNIENIAGQPYATFPLSNEEDFRNLRTAIIEIARAHRMDEVRAGDYRVAIGEAVTNATKHAGGGTVSIHILPGALFTIVSDKGPGIEALSIPKVALEKGYTTAGTLGMGYKVMISIADKIYLSTGPWGTMVGIEMSIEEPKVTPDISLLYRI
jgi:PAS domain S-box-containing protein